ncbi:MAG TPA: stage 0 sporulation family protein [Anaerolineae bacterium]|nr:stage 0 sporulation family protein [Anaerolineae bacterium]HNU03170.1 stage 0 sporulation family protein [Anaerolineae bacterium]
MPVVVGVSFHPVTKVYYFDPGALLDLATDEYVVVETAQGQEIGQVTWSPRAIGETFLAADLKPVVRRATASDLLERDRFQRKEEDVLAQCRARAREHRLPMNVVSAEYSYDGARLVVSFTAEGRVDFRDLVRDLARMFNARIEMKQIGVRDQAKVLDGVGKCGRQLCCSSWLREFNPVTIKMAKQQNLPLNPPEISGVCGRLLCCLAYESDVYEEARKQLPKVGAAVMTPAGEGRVRRVQPLRETVTVRLEDGAMQEFAISELELQGGKGGGRACGGCAMRRTAQVAAEEEELAAPAERQELDEGSPGGKRSRSKRHRNR